MKRVNYKTSWPLWLIASIAVFAAFGFLDPVGDTRGETFWGLLAEMVSGQRTLYGQFDVLVVVLFWIVPALIMGWLVQAVFVLLKQYLLLKRTA